MQPLLKIQSIPISIEYKIKRASLQHQAFSPPSYNMERQRGSLNLRTSHVKVNIDTFECRASAGLKSTARTIQEFASEGISAAYEATRAYAENGNYLMDSHGSRSAFAEVAASKFSPPPAQTILTFMPSVAPQFDVIPGEVSFDPYMDKLIFDWHTSHRPQLEYVPGGIEFAVTQYPQLQIEYIGHLNDAPPSASPDYVPPVMNTSV